jgi:peptidoglycan/xylan/chitin deacetylase (PgdA/CDA1 family)
MQRAEAAAGGRAPLEPVRDFRAGGDALYLTFDDGPDPHWTPRVLATLARHDARATFFVIGRLAARFGPLLREARAAGHAVASHGWSHRHPWTLDRAQARREVSGGADAIEQVLGERVHWFRPPHGRVTVHLAHAAHEQGQRIALWSLSALDWGPLGAPERIALRLARAAPGDIVLLHDGPRIHNRPAATLLALPAMLARAQRGRRALLPLPDATLAA